MAVIADWRGHREVDAHHPDRDLGHETLSPVSIAGEYRNCVALAMEVGAAQRLLLRGDRPCLFS